MFMIQVDVKHEQSSKYIFDNYGYNGVFNKSKILQSHDPKFLEKLINEFLEDKIYVRIITCVKEIDTSSFEEFSQKVKLYRHTATVTYQEWPF